MVAAAESVGKEIDTLTALGVNLSDVPLARLEWALQGDLHKAIHRFKDDLLTEAKLDDAVALVSLAAAKGLPVDSFVSELSKKYEESKKQVVSSAYNAGNANDMLRRGIGSRHYEEVPKTRKPCIERTRIECCRSEDG